MKPIDRLRSKDLEANGLWQFADDAEGIEGQDETSVVPVKARHIPMHANSLFVAADFLTSEGRKFLGLVQISTESDVRISPGAIVTTKVYAPLPDPNHWMSDSVLQFTESRLELSRKALYPLRYTLRHFIEGENEHRSGVFELGKTDA